RNVTGVQTCALPISGLFLFQHNLSILSAEHISTLGKSIPCKKLCYINPIEQHPYFFLFRSQFMAMVKQMLKSQSFKQCRLCCFVFLSSANIFVVPFLGKCLDIVSSQMLVILVHKDSIHTR